MECTVIEFFATVIVGFVFLSTIFGAIAFIMWSAMSNTKSANTAFALLMFSMIVFISWCLGMAIIT